MSRVNAHGHLSSFVHLLLLPGCWDEWTSLPSNIQWNCTPLDFANLEATFSLWTRVYANRGMGYSQFQLVSRWIERQAPFSSNVPSKWWNMACKIGWSFFPTHPRTSSIFLWWLDVICNGNPAKNRTAYWFEVWWSAVRCQIYYSYYSKHASLWLEGSGTFGSRSPTCCSR